MGITLSSEPKMSAGFAKCPSGEMSCWQGWGVGGSRQGVVKELGRNQLQLKTSGLDAFGSHWALLISTSIREDLPSVQL